MPRQFEGLSKTIDNTPKHSKDTIRLARLRAEHKFKVPLTAEQLGEHDDQAQAKWQENEYLAKQEIIISAQNCDVPPGYQPDRYRLRGGVIDPNEKLPKLADYLLPHERAAYRSARNMKHDGTKQSNLPAKEHQAFRLYDALLQMQKSKRVLSNANVNYNLDVIRYSDKYKAAFPDEP